jgi:tRNA pseudouridine55 synthase
VDGRRAYDRARRNEPVALKAVEVTAHALEVTEWSGTRLRLRLVCSAGFYVRSLAQALGERLGTGAHLAGLVRTRSGEFSLVDAVSVEELTAAPDLAAARVVPLAGLLPWLPSVVLTSQGASLAVRGVCLSAAHLSGSQVPEGGRVRLLHPDGRLVAIAESRGGGVSRLLHPGVVLE